MAEEKKKGNTEGLKGKRERNDMNTILMERRICKCVDRAGVFCRTEAILALFLQKPCFCWLLFTNHVILFFSRSLIHELYIVGDEV